MFSSSPARVSTISPDHASRFWASSFAARIEQARPPFMSLTPRPYSLPSFSTPPSGGTVHGRFSRIGKVSRWPLKISRRPGLPLLMRPIRLFTRGAGSITSISMPGISRSSASATLSISSVSLGGLGEATPTSRCVTEISPSSEPSTWRARALRTSDISACLQAAFPPADGHGQRPADQEIDDGNEGESLERPEVGGAEFHAAPGDLAHRDHCAQRRELDELHEVRGERRQGHADRLWQNDADEVLQW